METTKTNTFVYCRWCSGRIWNNGSCERCERPDSHKDLLASNKILIQQRDEAQQQRDNLLAACENLVRGQLQHPTLRAYVEHAVWVAEQAIAKTKEVKL